MAINNATLEREQQLAKLSGKGQLSANAQKKIDSKETKKPISSSQSSVKSADTLTKAPQIPNVPNLQTNSALRTQPVKKETSEIKPPISRLGNTFASSAFKGLPPNSSGQPNPPVKASTSSTAKPAPSSAPVATTPTSQNPVNPVAAALKAGNSEHKGPKNGGVFFFGIPS